MNEKVELARNLAIAFHGDQKYDDHEYIYHLDTVYDILRGNFTEKEEILAYLHDIKEDTDITFDELVGYFGAGISYAVYLISDCEGNNRAERKEKTIDKLYHIYDESFYFVLRVKVADRIANMRYSIKNNNKNMINMYKNEYVEFKKAAYRKNCCDDLWKTLDRLVETTILDRSFIFH